MALTKTTLINIQELYDEFEWAFEDEAQHLLDAEGEQVEVLCEATDGYWDIRLANGKEFEAISWYHLVGFNENSTTVSRNVVELVH